MKTSLRSRVFSALLALVMVFSLIPVSVFAGEAEPDSSALYTKVTEAPADWSGTYLIVYEQGENAYVYTGVDAASNYVAATIADGTIAGSAAVDAVTATIEKCGTGYAIKVKSGYISAKAGNNYTNFTSDPQALSLALEENGTVTIKSGDAPFQFNKASNNLRFRFFGKMNGGQQPVSLFKLASTEPERQSGIVTDLTDLQNGDSVVVFNPAAGKSLSTTYKGYYNNGSDVTLTDGVLTYADTDVWTLGINDDGTYTFSTTDGQKISLDTAYTSMPLDKVNSAWNLNAVADKEGFFYVENAGRSKYCMQYQSSYGTWSAYNNNTTGENFQHQLYLIIVEDEGGEPTPPTPSEPETATIAEALAGATGTEFTVKGAVTMIDGQNIYLQDATGGICLRLSSFSSEIALGDTIVGTGSRADFQGVPQLSSGTFQKSSGLTLSAKSTTIGALTTADICTYVKLSNVEVTEVYDGSGAYTKPNITVKDADGKTIQLYKAVIDKDGENWQYAVGDKLDIKAAVSYYQKDAGSTGKFQLRNTAADEVCLHQDVETGKLTAADQLTSGSYVMVVSTGYAPLELDGNWLTIVEPEISGNQVTDAKTAIWTLDVSGSSVTITDKNGVSIAPQGGNSNGIKSGEYSWAWSFNADNQTFKFMGTGSDTVTLASNNSMDSTYGGFNKFKAYKNTSVASQKYPCEFTLYKVDPSESGTAPGSDLPKVGDKFVIYNQNAKGVLAAQNDTESINNVSATIVDGKAVPGNGAVVFEVKAGGESQYLRFYNPRYGYLCSNGTGNNAFYSKDFSEEGVSEADADWIVRTCSGSVGGYELESRTAKFNGRYSQWLEYYSDCYKTYSMYNVSDYTIYSFFFYPVADGVKLQDDVVNDPKVVITSGNSVMKGRDYTLTFYLDDINTVSAESIKVSDSAGNTYDFAATTDGYSAVIPADKFAAHNALTFFVKVQYDGAAYQGELKVNVNDEPSIGAVTPLSNSQTGADKRPVISAELINVGENPTITMTINGEPVETVFDGSKVSYTPAADMADSRVNITVKVVRADSKTVSKSWSFFVGESQYQLYFGQLHSHTQYSDGSGSLSDALNYISNLPDSANVDFVAFTDHSNYFDTKSAANPEQALYDMSLATEYSQGQWSTYKNTIAEFNASQSDVVAIGGFEMTWSGGPGHINTFNTAGIVSRNNSTLNNKTSDAGMKAYYALLSQAEGADSISQFNHPGSTFGTFTDFSYWDSVIDTRIALVEVGNGEGQIGAGGYYPSYEYYTMALDKGWHVAPTNNQDNHKGRWGNANDARDVVLTDNFSEEGIYQAIRDMRVYSTEDKNLELHYTVNGMQLGSSITEVPEKLDFNVQVYDPDTSDSITKVELIVNSGKVAYTWDDPALLASGELTVTLDPTYSYYYVRVTQGDGDLAVTAPVWVGENLKLGISSFECGTSTPVTNEELTLTTTLFNSESSEVKVKSLTYTTNGGTVIGTDKTGYTMAASTTQSVDFKYTPTAAKITTITVTAVMELDGEEFTFTKDIKLDVLDASDLVYIGIDASHQNEYVSGNYKDSMGNFSNLAAEYSIRTVQLNTAEELLAACENADGKFKALILTAPSRRNGEALRDPYSTYSSDEINAIKAFNAAGGAVILAGWSDHYEAYPGIKNIPAADHMAAQQNAILAAMGSSLRVSDDATYDDVRSAADDVDPWRLYFSTYGENFLTEGVEVDAEHPYDRLYTEVFSHYGGASIYTVDGTIPSTVSPVVYGHATTYSKDVDEDGLGGSSIPKYAYADGDERLLVMASEQLDGQGLIVVSGAAFMSNFEVQATIEDNGSEKNYANYKICENLLRYLNPAKITPIGEIQGKAEEGYKYTIEGIVTSNASGYDKDTAFFDCIYVQDATGGICCFPVAGEYKIGDKVRITGSIEFYQGEMELQVSTIEVIGSGSIDAKDVTAAQINDQSVMGQLVTVKGTVESFELANGLVQTIMVKDAAGNVARVFIDGYITTANEVKNLFVGHDIVVTGISSYDNTFDGPAPRIRIRNRADVVISDSHNYVNGECGCGAKDPTFVNPDTNPDTKPDTKPDNKPTTPDTGDHFPIALWSTLMVLAAAGAVVLFLRKRKEQN